MVASLSPYACSRSGARGVLWRVREAMTRSRGSYVCGSCRGVHTSAVLRRNESSSSFAPLEDVSRSTSRDTKISLAVCKFGGTSMATAASFANVKNIMESEPSTRRGIVVSAPGKRFKGDVKTTDLLIQLYNLNTASGSSGATQEHAQDNLRQREALVSQIGERFEELLKEHGKGEKFQAEFEKVGPALMESKEYDFIVSRGEYLAGLAVSEILGFEFLDPQEQVFMRSGKLDFGYTMDALRNALGRSSSGFVLPGFFGYDLADKIVCALPRGGSDISGALLAAAFDADVYENWTDVDGVFTADPNVVSNARKIERLLYDDIVTLGRNGAQVLQPDTLRISPAFSVDVHLRNTFAPARQGTRIQSKSKVVTGERDVAAKARVLGLVVTKKPTNGAEGSAQSDILVVGNLGEDASSQGGGPTVAFEPERNYLKKDVVAPALRAAAGGLFSRGKITVAAAEDPWLRIEGIPAEGVSEIAAEVHEALEKKGVFDGFSNDLT